MTMQLWRHNRQWIKSLQQSHRHFSFNCSNGESMWETKETEEHLIFKLEVHHLWQTTLSLYIYDTDMFTSYCGVQLLYISISDEGTVYIYWELVLLTSLVLITCNCSGVNFSRIISPRWTFCIIYLFNRCWIINDVTDKHALLGSTQVLNQSIWPSVQASY